MTHSPETVAAALALAEEGATSWKIAAELGVPSSTIRGWTAGHVPQRSRTHPGAPACKCCGHPVHSFDQLPQAAYAYLLGLYLGDGCLSKGPREVFRLRISLDAKYPAIVAECASAIHTILPRTAVSTRHRGAKCNAYEVSSHSRQWPCLLPQHGPGKKHERLIALTAWQRTICASEPRALLRGLIHSDGCRSINTIHWRKMNRRTTSVARRADVARMDSFIGPKR